MCQSFLGKCLVKNLVNSNNFSLPVSESRSMLVGGTNMFTHLVRISRWRPCKPNCHISTVYYYMYIHVYYAPCSGCQEIKLTACKIQRSRLARKSYISNIYNK